MLTNQGQSRNLKIDILRILACFFIVLAHVSSDEILVLSIDSMNWKFSHVLNTIGHTGTMLFLFISGALLLSEDYDFKPKKFYTHNFLRLLTAYCAWVVIYHVAGLISRGQYSWIYIKDVIIGIIKGEAGYHFWYVPMLLGIYLLLPMLRAICRADKRVVNYFVILFLVVQVGFTTVKVFEFPYKHLVVSLMERIPFTLVNHYVGYFVMGYWLTEKLKKLEETFARCMGSVLLVAGIVGSLVGDMLLTKQNGYNSIFFNDLFSIAMCMSATGVFVLVHSFDVRSTKKMEGLLVQISQLTFGVYMLHPMMLGIIIQLPFWKHMPIVIGYPLRAVAVFCVSMLISWMLSWIPGIREWVMYAGKRKLYQSHASEKK